MLQAPPRGTKQTVHCRSRRRMVPPRPLFQAPGQRLIMREQMAHQRWQLEYPAEALRRAAQARAVGLSRQRHRVAACKAVQAMPR